MRILLLEKQVELDDKIKNVVLWVENNKHLSYKEILVQGHKKFLLPFEKELILFTDSIVPVNKNENFEISVLWQELFIYKSYAHFLSAMFDHFYYLENFTNKSIDPASLIPPTRILFGRIDSATSKIDSISAASR